MKSIFLSKTLWANVLMGIGGVLGELNGVVPPGVSAIVQTVVNIGLRFLTSTPVTVTGK